MATRSRVDVIDRGLKRFFERLKELDRLEVVVGVTAEDGAKDHKGAPLITIAATHEFGSPARNIPQRSFLRNTFDANAKKYERMMENGAKKIVKAKSTPKKELFVLGETARADVIDRINSNIPPPLKEATAVRKGSDLALVEDGALRNSISSVVRKAKSS